VSWQRGGGTVSPYPKTSSSPRNPSSGLKGRRLSIIFGSLGRERRILPFEDLEGPQFAGGADRPTAAVLGVTGGELRTRRPRLKVSLRTPASEDQAEIAPVVGPQQLKSLKPRRRLNSARASGEPIREFVQALARY
jgi:hypothetical protein